MDQKMAPACRSSSILLPLPRAYDVAPCRANSPSADYGLQAAAGVCTSQVGGASYSETGGNGTNHQANRSTPTLTGSDGVSQIYRGVAKLNGAGHLAIGVLTGNEAVTVKADNINSLHRAVAKVEGPER